MSLGLRTARLAVRAGAMIPPRVAGTRALSTRTFSALSPSLRSPSLLARRPPPIGRRFNSTSSSSSGPSSSNSGQDTAEPKSAYQRFKALTKTYGSYAVIMYLALSAVDFSLSFAVVHAVGVDRIEPYTDRLVRWYRVARHGKAGADALEASDDARKLAEEAEEAADVALHGKKEVPWYWNKKLWAEIALAYSIHKVGLLPIRAGLTVAWTPKVVNFLRARGWIGTVSPRARRDSLAHAQSGAKRAVQHGTDRMRVASQRALQQAKDATRRPPQ